VKIAVPLFGRRVSPRFDCAPIFLVVQLEPGGLPQRQHIVVTDWTARERVEQLQALAVNILICGGIDRWSAEALQASGIRIQSAVIGDVEEALAGWMRNEVLA
jgi:predicted Fe-Mo cluster-binding NifX family protein